MIAIEIVDRYTEMSSPWVVDNSLIDLPPADPRQESGIAPEVLLCLALLGFVELWVEVRNRGLIIRLVGSVHCLQHDGVDHL